MANNDSIKTSLVRIDVPEGINVIFGMTHFIKSVEDLYETLVESSPTLKFGVAFSEASGKRLIRHDGNDQSMIDAACKAATAVGCGHTFWIFLKDGFPVNVLNRVKNVSEVCRIFCATANPVQVIVGETSLGRGVMGVIDGEPPLGIEGPADKQERLAFLRTIRYKRG